METRIATFSCPVDLLKWLKEEAVRSGRKDVSKEIVYRLGQLKADSEKK